MSGTDPERAISTGLLALEEKVREAVKLLTSLREKNIELSTELGELKGELESIRHSGESPGEEFEVQETQHQWWWRQAVS